MTRKITKTLIFLFVLNSVAWSQVPTDGLAGFWPFNGSAADESGNKNNGTVTDVSPATDRFGNTNSAYMFNGLSSFIQIPGTQSIEMGASDFTISCWVNLAGDQGIATYLFGKSSSNTWMNGNKSFYVGGGLNSPGFNSCNQGMPNISTQLQENNWYHLVCTHTKSSNAITIYVNKSATDISLGFTLPADNQTDVIYIGKVGNASTFFNGIIDDIRFYNRVISHKEVTELYHEGGYEPAMMTRLTDTLRGKEVEHLAAQLSCDTVKGASSYEWQFTPIGSCSTIVHESEYSTMQAGQAALGFDNSYKVRIRAKVGDIWGVLGYEDTIHTPVEPLTRLGAQFHNAHMISLQDTIVCHKVKGATLYLYQFVDEKSGLRFRHYNKGNSLRVSDVAGIELGRSYKVTVLPRFYNSLSSFSVGARIYTPSRKSGLN